MGSGEGWGAMIIPRVPWSGKIGKPARVYVDKVRGQTSSRASVGIAGNKRPPRQESATAAAVAAVRYF